MSKDTLNTRTSSVILTGKMLLQKRELHAANALKTLRAKLTAYGLLVEWFEFEWFVHCNLTKQMSLDIPNCSHHKLTELQNIPGHLIIQG
jgi:hypothetical protein